MFCNNCGKELEAGTVFCDACGTKVQQEAPAAYAPADETVYLGQQYAPAQEQEYAAPIEEAPIAPPAKFDIKKLIPVGIVAAVVIALAVIAVLIFGGKKAPTAPTLYVKGKELVVGAKNPWEVTSDMGTSTADTTILAPDGKTLFYADKLDSGDTIYYRNIKSEKSDAMKLDSDIEELYISEDSKTVIYLREDGVLYRRELSETKGVKISGDVENINAYTRDMERVLYTTTEEVTIKKDGESYKETVRNLNIDIDGESEEIASEIDYAFAADKKLTEAYYVADNTLTKVFIGEDEEEAIVKDNFYSIEAIYESGELYYLTEDKEEVKTEATATATENLNDKFTTNADGKRMKVTYDLYYYDGDGEHICVSEDIKFENYIKTEVAKDEPILIYTTEEKVKEKDKDGKEKIVTEYTTYIVEAGGESTEIEFSDKDTTADDCYMNDDGSKLFYKDNRNTEKNTFDLFEAKISGGVVEDAVEYDTGISSNGSRTIDVEEEIFIYAKNYKDGKYDLYYNAEELANDVESHSHYSDANVIVIKSSTDKKGTYTLSVSKGGKEVIEVADGISSWTYYGNGKIAYLADVSLTNFKGDVYEYYAGKSEPTFIDDDVTDLVACEVRFYED